MLHDWRQNLNIHSKQSLVGTGQQNALGNLNFLQRVNFHFKGTMSLQKCFY